MNKDATAVEGDDGAGVGENEADGARSGDVANLLGGGKRMSRTQRNMPWESMPLPATNPNPSMLNNYIDTCVDATTGDTRPDAPFYADHHERVSLASAGMMMEEDGGHGKCRPVVMEGSQFVKAVVDENVSCHCAACHVLVPTTATRYEFCPTFPRPFIPLCATCAAGKLCDAEYRRAQTAAALAAGTQKWTPKVK